MRGAIRSLLIMLATPIIALAQTPVDSSMDRHILGHYSLRQLESGSTYVLVKPTTVDEWGELGGKVIEIGWFDQAIVVWREDSSGSRAYYLIVIEQEEEVVVGPMPDLNIEAPSGFRLLPVEKAWKSLK